MVRELLNYYSKDRVELIFEHYKNYLVEVKETEKIIQEALKLKEKVGVPLFDVVHALLAKANGATLISRDKHFEKLEHIVQIRLPEDFI